MSAANAQRGGMKKVALGFALGWAAAFIPCLIGTKFQGPVVRRIIRKYGPSGYSAEKLERMR